LQREETFHFQQARLQEHIYQSRTGPKNNDSQEHKIAKCIFIHHIGTARHLSTQNKELLVPAWKTFEPIKQVGYRHGMNYSLVIKVNQA